MATNPPEGYHTVTPFVIVRDSPKFLDFLAQAFGASGDRAGRVRDPLGNLWWIMSRIEDVPEDEINRRMGDPQYLETLQRAQSSEFFPTDRGG